MKKFLVVSLLTSLLAFDLAAYHGDRDTECGFFASADFLYWHADQGGMAYGFNANFNANIQPAPLPSAQSFIGSDLNVCFRSDPGVRLAIGYQHSQDSWRTDLIWTHLNTNASGASHNPDEIEGTVVVPYYFTPTPLPNNAINAAAAWCARYNTLDLDIHKNLCVCDSVSFQPHIGLRALWLSEKYNICCIKNWDNEEDPVLFINSQTNMVQKNWGVGPLVGFSSQWNMCGGFSWFGNGSLALMWSRIRSCNVGTILTEEPAVTTNRVLCYRTTLPELGAIVGAQYDFTACDDYALSVRIGWEFNTLFEVNYLGAYTFSAGNFNLSGLTVGVACNF